MHSFMETPTHTPQKNWHEKIQSHLKMVAESNKASMVMYGIGVFLIAIIIFQAGMIVGRGKESVINEQKESYLVTKPLPTAHGTAGTIVSINLPTLIVADEDHTEKVVLVKDETIIRSLRNTIDVDELKPSDYIVVIGTPTSQGYIQANLIRVLPKN
jgi:hypothetical protein